MTAQHDLDTILAAWLDEGPTDLPDATRRAIVTALPTTTQRRRGVLAPWRPIDMNGFGRLAGAALVAVIAIGGLIYVLNPNLGPGNPSPSPADPTPAASTPSPTVAPTTAAPTAPSAAPTAAPTLSLLTFTSPSFGYTVQHPPTWSAVAGTGTWPAGGPVGPDQAYVDRFAPPGSPVGTIVMLAAQPIPDGTSGAEWMTAWAEQREAVGGPCFGPASTWTDATVAGADARRIEAPCAPEAGVPGNFVEYAWVIDGTGYVITGAPASVLEQIVGSFQPG